MQFHIHAAPTTCLPTFFLSSPLRPPSTPDAIRELGEFYQKNGQRVALTRPVRESVLAHLTAAEAALPPEDQDDKFLGIF